MSEITAVYSRKRIGPRTDLCGTPHKISVGDDAEDPVGTYWCPPARYDMTGTSQAPFQTGPRMFLAVE